MAAKPSQTGTDSIPGAAPLTAKGDLAAAMVAGISRDLDRRNREAVEKRERHWQRDLSSPAAYAKSVARNRRELARIIGLVDEREPVRFELFGQTGPRVLCEAPVAMANDYPVTRARWAVLPGVEAEGLVLDPTPHFVETGVRQLHQVERIGDLGGIGEHRGERQAPRP